MVFAKNVSSMTTSDRPVSTKATVRWLRLFSARARVKGAYNTTCHVLTIAHNVSGLMSIKVLKL